MPDGLTRPLHMACSSGYEKAATLLLDHHADIDAIGPKGHRPLHLAAKEERAVIVEVRKELSRLSAFPPLVRVRIACVGWQLT